MAQDDRMARTMTDEEWRAFASSGTRTAMAATVRADGSPRVAPVRSPLLDGRDVVLTTGTETVTGRSMDETAPYASVMRHGRVRLSEAPDEPRTWATQTADRYPDSGDEAEASGARHGVPGELLARVTVKRAVAVSGGAR